MLDLIEAPDQEAASEAERVRVRGIAIMGSNPLTRDMAPFPDASWRIWACSPDNSPHGHAPFAKELSRVDQWFELHDNVEDKSRPYAYLRWLEGQSYRVWMRDKKNLAQFANGQVYPFEELFGVLKTEPYRGADGYVRSRVMVAQPGLFSWWSATSSIALMLAAAIAECERTGIKTIGIFGVMQASKNEYAYQRPGIQNMIWEAAKRGISVICPDVQLLLEPPQEQW
jgi:hypothetical protein